MKTPTNERAEWIFQELVKNPALEYKQCFRKYEPKFSKTQPTFTKEWKIAKARHEEHQIAVNETKLEVMRETELKAVEQGILDKLGNMKILSDIIQNAGEMTADRIRAVDVLNRMQGNYAIDNEQSSAKTIVWNEIKNYKKD